MNARIVLLAMALFVLGGCSDATVMVVSNQTTCSFENVQGFKVRSRGEPELVFAFDRVDPRDDRPAYFKLDWKGALLITADQPVGYEQEFYVSRGMENMTIPLVAEEPMDCRLRSAEEY